MKNFFPRILLLCSALLMLAGCASNTRLAGLSTRLASIHVPETSERGRTPVTVTIRFVNDNLLPIAISNSRHKIYINGSLLGEIESERPVGLPRLDSAVQELPLDADASLLATLPIGSPVNYRIESMVEVEAGAQDMRTKSQYSGSVVLER